jgi:cytochrome P450
MFEGLFDEVPPGPRGLPLLGSLVDFVWGDPIRTVLDALREHGDVVRFRFGPYHFYVVNHPDHIRHVLQENRQNYVKSINYETLVPVLGRGLLTNEGERWLRQRRLIQPGFHRQRIAGLATEMTTQTAAMLTHWQQYEASGEAFDVAQEMMRLTFAIVGRTLFSVDLSGEAEAIGPALTVALEWANDRTVQLVRLPLSVPTPANRRVLRAIETLDAMVFRIIEERRRRPAGGHDLLSMLLEARDERTGEGMSDQQLRDEVMTLVLAGHETTANALTWTLYLLSKHPTVARRLRAEVVGVLGERVPTSDDLPQLPYTLRVIEEALRLYPPAWWIERQSVRADEIGEYSIEPQAFVAIVPYAMHRHPTYWDNPEGFDPDRFAPERAADRPKFAYLPFGGGPRQCIGNGFALMEAQLVLAMLMQHYRLDLVPGHPVEPEPLVTLRARHGVRVTAHRWNERR